MRRDSYVRVKSETSRVKNKNTTPRNKKKKKFMV